jgi:hypothetical protein
VTRGATLPSGLLGLIASYVRGEKTADEVREAAAADPELGPLVPRCLGVFTFPHEILEAAGSGPFDPEMTFDEPMGVTREGLLRNLRLAREGVLSPEGLCDWAADWMSWQIVDPPDDDVVLELCGELMVGPEEAERIVRDEDAYARFTWHAENTPGVVAERCSLALAAAEQREDLERRLGELLADEIDEDGFRTWVRQAFSEVIETLPTLDDDLVEASSSIRGRGDDLEAAARFVRCLALRGDPPTCADDLDLP